MYAVVHEDSEHRATQKFDRAVVVRRSRASFDEAKQLFVSGVDYLEIVDETHSTEEERFIAIGPIQRGVVLVVWTERAEGTIRIIGARWASKREHELYRTYSEVRS